MARNVAKVLHNRRAFEAKWLILMWFYVDQRRFKTDTGFPRTRGFAGMRG